jgi:hypothetical protein
VTSYSVVGVSEAHPQLHTVPNHSPSNRSAYIKRLDPLDTMVRIHDHAEKQFASHPVSTDPTLAIHPVASQDGVVVRVQPSKGPSDPNIPHVPCDIVLVIDVSGSMAATAPAPMSDANGNTSQENFGLSILDLTKHAARTIIDTLNEGDRLGIVTFETSTMVRSPK